ASLHPPLLHDPVGALTVISLTLALLVHYGCDPAAFLFLLATQKITCKANSNNLVENLRPAYGPNGRPVVGMEFLNRIYVRSPQPFTSRWPEVRFMSVVITPLE